MREKFAEDQKTVMGMVKLDFAQGLKNLGMKKNETQPKAEKPKNLYEQIY